MVLFSLSLPHSDTRGVCSVEQECVCLCVVKPASEYVRGVNRQTPKIIAPDLLEQTYSSGGEVVCCDVTTMTGRRNSEVGWQQLKGLDKGVYGRKVAYLNKQDEEVYYKTLLFLTLITSLVVTLNNQMQVWKLYAQCVKLYSEKHA